MAEWFNKVAVVTGGSSGLGLSIGASFARRGALVVAVGRDAERLKQAEAVLQEASEASRGAEREARDKPVRGSAPSVLTIAADVTREEEVESLFRRVRETFGRLDVLVNNVGRSSRRAVIETPPEEFQELWETNFLSAVRCTRAAAESLLATRGHVVNIGSLAGKQASRFLGAYPASKAPLVAYSQQLRLELSPQGLHVLLVCPGPIARSDAGHRYDSQTEGLPESARRPGGGVKLKSIDPGELAERIVLACERRRAELIVPAKARWLFALSQISAELGDWIVRKKT